MTDKRDPNRTWTWNTANGISGFELRISDGDFHVLYNDAENNHITLSEQVALYIREHVARPSTLQPNIQEQ